MKPEHYIYKLSEDLTLNIGAFPDGFQYGELISKEEGTLTLVPDEIKELIKAIDEFKTFIQKRERIKDK